MRLTHLSIALVVVLAACAVHGSAEDEATSSGADALAASTTKTELEANNTAASGAFRDRYTPASRFNGAAIGVVSNGDMPVASTTASSLAVGSVSKIPIRSLLYPGS
ncbi:MAG TPA: hypothetical protein VIF62_08115, partial [Labilithrix sp.]